MKEGLYGAGANENHAAYGQQNEAVAPLFSRELVVLDISRCWRSHKDKRRDDHRRSQESKSVGQHSLQWATVSGNFQE